MSELFIYISLAFGTLSCILLLLILKKQKDDRAILNGNIKKLEESIEITASAFTKSFETEMHRFEVRGDQLKDNLEKTSAEFKKLLNEQIAATQVELAKLTQSLEEATSF